MTQADTHSRLRSATIAAAVAVVGLGALLLVNHGPWNKRSAESATMIEVGKTAGAAAAVGAVVSQTALPPAPVSSRPMSDPSAIRD